MKAAVYVAMCLLLGPMVPVAGVVLSGVYIAFLFGLGVYLIFGRKDRSESGPEPLSAPQVVVVLPGGQPWAQAPVAPYAVADEPAGQRAVHPARRPADEDRPPLWLRPGR